MKDKNNNLMMSLVRLHDADFRKNYQGKRTNYIEYKDGSWFCDEMVESRKKDKDLIKLNKEFFEERGINYDSLTLLTPNSKLV